MKQNTNCPPPPCRRILTHCGLFFVCFFFFSISEVTSPISLADDFYWTNSGIGNWSDSDNWDTFPVAGYGNDIYINTGTMNFNVPGSVGPFHDYYIANGMGTTATVNHSSGDIYVNSRIHIGTDGGTGTLVHSGGDLDVWSISVGARGGTGTLYHSGGLIHVEVLDIGIAETVSGIAGLANISGGTLECGILGVGGINAILNHSGGTTTTMAMMVGAALEDNTKGTVNFTGGNLHLGEYEYSEFSSINGLFIGMLESAGEFNLSGGVVTVDTDLGTNIGFMGGTGTFHQTGGSFTSSNNHVFIGNGEGSTGTFMHSGGDFVGDNGGIHVGYDGGSGTFIHSGGSMQANGLFVGGEGAGLANISGGTLECDAIFVAGYEDTDGVINHSGGTTTADMMTVGLDEFSKGVVNVTGGNLQINEIGLVIGGLGGVGEFNLFGGVVTVNGDILGTVIGGDILENVVGGEGVGTLNIHGGSLNAGDISGNALSSMNVFGSKAKINADSVTGDQTMNFTLDSGGVSKLEVAGTFDENTPVVMKMPGAFLSVKENSIDVITAGSDFSGLVPDNRTPFIDSFVNDGTILRLSMADTADSWNLLGSHDILDGPQESGAIKVYGEYTYIQAVFDGLDGTLAPLLRDYLNESLLDNGVQFALLDDTSLLLIGDYLGGEGYAYFAWDLSDFNIVNFSNIGLMGLNEVPEPATWAMLILGGAAMVGMRLRKRK